MTNKSKVAELLEGVKPEFMQNGHAGVSYETIERVFGPALAELRRKLEWRRIQCKNSRHALDSGAALLAITETDLRQQTERAESGWKNANAYDKLRIQLEAENATLRQTIADLNEHISAQAALLVQQERELENGRRIIAEYNSVMKMLDLQAIGNALGIPLGEYISSQILPKILQLQEQNASLSRAVSELQATKDDYYHDYYRNGVAQGYQEATVHFDMTSKLHKLAGQIPATDKEIADIQAELDAAPQPPIAEQASLTSTYVQDVPDKCDRIIWRGNYYHLPIIYRQPEPSVNDELLAILIELRNSLYQTYSLSPGGKQYLSRIDAAIQRAEAAKKESGE